MKNSFPKLNSFRRFSSDIRSFKQIPSPKSYPVLGHAYLFFKNGPYTAERLTEAVQDLSQKYGPIFYLKFPNQNFVITTDAENAFKLFQYEGKFPNRVPLPALALYQRRTFDSIGVIPQNDENWYKLRKALSPLLLKTYLANFTAENERIADTFVNYIGNERGANGVLSDVCKHMYKYAILCIGNVCPGVSIESSETMERIIEGSCTFMDGLYCTYSEPPLWKLIKTKGYQKLKQGHDIVNEFMLKEISKPTDNWRSSFMKILFENNKLSPNEARVLSTEVFLSGIDSVSTTIAMTLFYLSKHAKCQELALLDMANGSDSYLKACIKETLRLSSTAGGTTRALPVDCVMNGYNIPANTYVTAFHSVMSTMEKYFDHVNSYMPERWLHEGKLPKKDEYSNYASLPFGYGARVCPGRWLTEQEIVILLKAILKNFILECDPFSTEIGMIYRMNRIPDKPVNIKFIERDAKKP